MNEINEESWFNLSIKQVEEKVNTNIENGLNDEQYKQSLEKNGYNELKEKKKKSLLQKFIDQFKDFMIIILLIAAIVSGVVGYLEGEGFTDSIIILFIVVVNAIIGVIQESRAEASLEALKKMSGYVAKVLRNGKIDTLPTKEIVPGDIVILETGDFVPADMRLFESVNLKIQEASLTGESVPVEKSIDIIEDKQVGIGDRTNMAFSSSMVTYGRGKGIVVETGMNTEVGKIAEMIENADSGMTPLQKKLEVLGKTLGISALIICVIIFVIGLLYGKEPVHMFMSAVSLAVAAIPEGLPAIATIVLSMGVQRMVKKNAIVRKLPSVETLGSATVICSDKTGTLTQNKMTVVKTYYNSNVYDSNQSDKEKEEFSKLMQTAILCNDTKILNDVDGRKLIGDPTETALIDLAYDFNLDKLSIDMQAKRIAEVPFDSDRKLMTTINKENDKIMVYTKGAVDELLKRCNHISLNGSIRLITDDDISYILRNNEEMANQALRVLGFAYKEINSLPEKIDDSTIENDLVFVGMVGMIDPPRPEVKDAVAKCKTAGITTVMITGDHKITAMAIAKELGILENDNQAIEGIELENMSDEELVSRVRELRVYARVSPEHKVRIVKAWQANGEIVAMTGDGVNDAPSLKTADIGCAMGITGTDVSKEAADVVLTDDNFATIVSAVEEGRRIYDNILKSIQFLISSNIGEIITLFTVIMATPIIAKIFNISDVSLIEPLLPIHILWVNLVTDSLPALALSVEPAEKDIMKRKAKSGKKQIFTKGMVWRIIYQGIMIGALTLVAFFVGMSTTNEPILNPAKDGYLTLEQSKIEIGQTMAFAVLAISQLVHAFNNKSKDKSLFKVGILNNKPLIGAFLLSLVLMIAVLNIPFLQSIFSTVPITLNDFLVVTGLSIAPLVIVELFKLLKINSFKED